MNENDKAKLKVELQGIQGNLVGLESIARAVAGQGSMPIPVAGNMVIVTTFQMVSQALQAQKDALQKMAKLMEQIIDKA